MLSTLGQRLSAIFRATAPDPFVIAALLTALTFLLALLFTDATPISLIDSWSADEGVWAFLGFSMQMCLILVTGHALASSPLVAHLLGRLANTPRTAAQGVGLVALVAGVLGVLNWGLGLIAGAIFAREVGRSAERRGVPMHYPLLAGAGYVGLLVWHGGFSGTAPLKVTTERELRDVLGALADSIAPIPLTETILSPMNLVTTGGLLLLAPIIMARLSPRRPEHIEPASRFLPALKTSEGASAASERAASSVGTNALPDVERDGHEFRASRLRAVSRPARIPHLLENTPIVTVILVAMIAVWAWRYYLPADLSRSGVRNLTPNTVNLTMLMLGLILHGTPRRYVNAIEEAVGGCAGIILQFPLYAGVMGMMATSGLTAKFAHALASGAGETALPVLTFLSAGVVNLFIPSGGGQWGVQGPIAMQAALDVGVAPSKMVLAIAYGDQLTNMLQPFWALPLLALTGVRARDIVGYTAVLMVVAGAWITGCLLLF